MEAKEKAKELYDKYVDLLSEEMPALRHREEFKQCALICVDEIIDMVRITDLTYWNYVKEEINKL